MSNQIEDLWPDLSPTAILTPVSILRTQAAALSERTRGLLQADVRTRPAQDELHHSFSIVVPALDNYRYNLLRIHHSLARVYPVYVDHSPADKPSPQEVGLAAALLAGDPPLEDESSFREWLRNTFAAPETKRILESLLAQASA
jgi:hypothetical protein